MKINRMLSLSLCIMMCLLGLLVGVTIAWIPSLILSILGIGSPFLALMGILGASAGFIAYVKICKKFNCWPMYTPERSSLQQAIYWVYPKSENTLCEDTIEVIKAFEKEVSRTYSLGWKNFKIEYSNESGPLFNSKNDSSLLEKVIESTVKDQSKFKRK